jgi:hypothetical protein
MSASNRIERGIDAGTALASCGKPTHGRDEVAGVIIDGRGTEALDYGDVRGRASADRIEAQMASQVEQSRADRARSADDQDPLCPAISGYSG